MRDRRSNCKKKNKKDEKNNYFNVLRVNKTEEEIERTNSNKNDNRPKNREYNNPRNKCSRRKSFRLLADVDDA